MEIEKPCWEWWNCFCSYMSTEIMLIQTLACSVLLTTLSKPKLKLLYLNTEGGNAWRFTCKCIKMGIKYRKHPGLEFFRVYGVADYRYLLCTNRAIVPFNVRQCDMSDFRGFRKNYDAFLPGVCNYERWVEVFFWFRRLWQRMPARQRYYFMLKGF